MPKLSKAEFKSTFSEPLIRLGQDEMAPFDFWPYFEMIPSEDFEGFDCSEGDVHYVWQDSTGSIDHVLINSNDKNVFMVIILDLNKQKVIGHRLLNLNIEYGIST